MQWFFGLGTWQQALLVSLMMDASTALGASLVLFSKKFPHAVQTCLCAGAAGIMLAASFFSLLLPALGYETTVPAWLSVTLGFFLGGLFIAGSDFFFGKRSFRRLGKKNGLMFLAVTLHNIPEGMAVGVAIAAAGSGHGAMFSALLFAVGIAVQNFPEGACVAFPLRAGGMRAARAFAYSQASGLVEIPACVLGALAASVVEGIMPWALAFSAGAMIAVVCSELVPECFAESKRLATAGVVLGFCLMMLLDVALG